ncbi:hypothetical protein [Flavihumibacter fluvii]|uniref:hypothetical protein n=1 Tax=Flavihumibacter fluvii TaxID=2838157 RepID=UPI001BDE2B07|nr:hypothetical protein [Flavihumibacter fluvii]ULQ50868.1 hypothetical protein KJS93_12315 [Flavihumibacter fluvii]
MTVALQKALTLVLLLGLGVLLRRKLKHPEALGGLKEIILSVALPSTIFLALLKIEMDLSMILIPIITLLFNLIIFYTIPFCFPFFGVEKSGPAGRTMMLLVPSLAPGLSCFPFIAEFLGPESLATAALADIGNKVFVLVFLYVIALNMFMGNSLQQNERTGTKVKKLFSSLLKEPVNLVIIAAIILLSLGFKYSSLPAVIADLVEKTSALMTPLVLLFIGLAVQWRESRRKLVITVLFFRAGITMLISAAMINILHINAPHLILLAIVVPQSSTSFWPLAHISAFHHRENELGLSMEKRSFDMELAILTLGFSLPFSTLLILGILSTGTFFIHSQTLVATGFLLMFAGALPYIRTRVHRFSRT